jgi:hypothetical protein
MDGLVEGGDVCEGLVGEVMGLKIAPDRFDFIEFGGVFWLHSTVSQWARAARAASERLLVWIGPLSSTSTTGLACRPGLRSKETVELLQMGDEIAAALGRASRSDNMLTISTASRRS